MWRSERESGSAIIGVLTTVAIFGIVSAGMASLAGDIWKTQNSAKSLSEANNFHEEMRSHLGRPENCLATFGQLGPYGGGFSKVVSSVKFVHPTSGVVSDRYRPGVAYASNSFEIQSMWVTYRNPENPSDPNEALFSLRYKPRGAVLGPDVFRAREIVLSLQIGAGGVLLGCLAKARMSDGLWRRAAAPQQNDIFFDGGSVGVGTTSPAAKLDVAGAVKFGGDDSVCSSSKAGAIRYNSALKIMEFCNGLTWGAVGGDEPPGSWCGSAGDTYNVYSIQRLPCKGMDVSSGCPAGYTRREIMSVVVYSGDDTRTVSLLTCMKD